MTTFIKLRENGSRIVSHVCQGESLTQQQFKKDTVLSQVIERMLRTGLYSPADYNPIFDDFTSVEDFQTTLENVNRIEEAFLQLPLWLRKKFDHDPAKVVAFVNDPSNYDKAVEYGLLQKVVDDSQEPTSQAKAEPNSQAKDGTT